MSRLLLDTHLLIWAAADAPRITSEIRTMIADPANDVCFSIASVWEIAIKFALPRRGETTDPAELLHALRQADYRELPITGEHALAVARLPPLHKDPFDRLLIAQAALEGATLLTADATIARYPGRIRLVA